MRCPHFLFGPLFCLFLVFLGCSEPRPPQIQAPVDPQTILRGYSLVEGLAACGYCHASAARPLSVLDGGRVWHDNYGPVIVPNISSSSQGIGEWETKQFLMAMRQNVRPDEEPLLSDAHEGYEWMSDDDLLAILSYLRSMKGSDNSVERREVSFIDRNTTGFFESLPVVKGYVPPISPRFEREYGKYLVDQVARCQFCHSNPGSLVEASGYLEGGRVIKIDQAEFETPSLTSSPVDGLGDWSEADILVYLVSGKTPNSAGVAAQNDGSPGCPLPWFANSQERDLRAIARYLKSLP